MRDDAGNRRFLAAAFCVCAAGALWLLLSPAAFDRRARERELRRLRAETALEWRYNLQLERYSRGLLDDPAVIALEARRLGYGRPGERFLPLTRADLAAALHDARRDDDGLGAWAEEAGRSVLPAVIIILTGALAMLFFTQLRIDDPLRMSGPTPQLPDEEPAPWADA